MFSSQHTISYLTDTKPTDALTPSETFLQLSGWSYCTAEIYQPLYSKDK